MNFQELFAKIRAIDENIAYNPKIEQNGNMEPTSVPHDGDDMLTGECGGMMPQQSTPKQANSVTMNVSMNGSGADGIKDLLDIIRNVQGNGEQDSDAVLVGIGAEESIDGNFGSTTTQPDPAMISVPDSGDDLHREKEEYPKANGGGNPMRMHEELVSKLAAKYNEIKGD